MNNKILLILGGGALLYLWYESQQKATPTTTPAPAGTNTAGTTQTTGTGAGTTGGTQTTTTPAMSLAAIWAAMLGWAKKDQQFTTHDGDVWGTPYHWNFYLTYVDPTPPAGGGEWPPDVTQVLPGVDVNNTMISSTQYWAAMAPWLREKYGLSGLGRVQFAHRGGWAA